LAGADVEEFLATTRYADAPIVPVSGVTGEGLPALLSVLDELGARVPPRPAYPATRMPVDRVFSLRGIGTVVTGTLWSGRIGAEDTVAILPPRHGRGSSALREVRVRSVQVHDREVAEAVGGRRVALNLTGVDRDEVVRGQWVVKDPAIEPTYLADVRLTLLTDAGAPLPRISRVRVDHGTAEVLAKVVLADRQILNPGGSCYAQVRFDERCLVYPGDQFIVRSVTPVTTIGGGRVIDPAPRKHSTGQHWHDRLAVLEDGRPEAVAALLLQESFPSGPVRGRFETSPYLWPFTPEETREAVVALLADGRALAVGAGVGGPGGETRSGAVGPNVRLFHGPSLLALTDAALTALRAKADDDPLDPYLTLGDLRRELAGGRGSPALEVALDRLQDAGEAIRSEHGYRWAGAAVAARGAQAEVVERLLEQFSAGAAGQGPTGRGEVLGSTAAVVASGAAETPSVTAAAEAVGLTVEAAQKVIDALVRQGRLVRVGEDLYYPPDRLEALIGRIIVAMEAAGQVTLAEVRDLLGTSRRYSQALLEHMDSEGLTLRVGEARRLRRRRR